MRKGLALVEETYDRLEQVNLATVEASQDPVVSRYFFLSHIQGF